MSERDGVTYPSSKSQSPTKNESWPAANSSQALRDAVARDDDRRGVSAQVAEDAFDGVVDVDRLERRAHRGGDRLLERSGIAEDPLEEPAVGQRADDVGERAWRRALDDREL